MVPPSLELGVGRRALIIAAYDGASKRCCLDYKTENAQEKYLVRKTILILMFFVPPPVPLRPADQAELLLLGPRLAGRGKSGGIGVRQ